MKRVLIIGSTKLTQDLIELLLESQSLEIAGILTGQEEFQISYSVDKVHNFNYANLIPLTESRGIPSYRMLNGMSESELNSWVSSIEFDFILVVGWYHLIPKSWTENFVCLGIHASLLPKYRGGAPLVWALLNGESESGVTLFRLDEGVDTGLVLAQEKFTISDEDTVADLLKKTKVATLKVCDKTLPRLDLKNELIYKRQEGNVSIYPQRSPVDGKIRNVMKSKELRNFIRAQTRPYPGAYLEKNSLKLYIWSCKPDVTNFLELTLGEIQFDGNSFSIQCQDGLLVLNECTLIEDGNSISDNHQIWKRWNEN